MTDLRLLLEEVLSETVTVQEGDRTRTISKFEAMFHAQMRSSLKGNQRVILALFKAAEEQNLFSHFDPLAGHAGLYRKPSQGEEAQFLELFRAEQSMAVPSDNSENNSARRESYAKRPIRLGLSGSNDWLQAAS